MPMERNRPQALILDIGIPFPPRFDLVALGDFVAELGFDVAVESEVGFLVEEGGAVRV